MRSVRWVSACCKVTIPQCITSLCVSARLPASRVLCSDLSRVPLLPVPSCVGGKKRWSRKGQVDSNGTLSIREFTVVLWNGGPARSLPPRTGMGWFIPIVLGTREFEQSPQTLRLATTHLPRRRSISHQVQQLPLVPPPGQEPPIENPVAIITPTTRQATKKIHMWR